MIVNPFYRPETALGFSDATWTAIKDALRAYAQARPSQAAFTEGELRALRPELADAKSWGQAKAALGLREE